MRLVSVSSLSISTITFIRSVLLHGNLTRGNLDHKLLREFDTLELFQLIEINVNREKRPNFP